MLPRSRAPILAGPGPAVNLVADDPGRGSAGLPPALPRPPRDSSQDGTRARAIHAHPGDARGQRAGQQGHPLDNPAERPINGRMAMDTSKLTEKAKEAVQRRNYEYAIDLYQQALALNPEDIESRRELRQTEARYVQERGISPFSAWLKGLGSVVKIFLASKGNAEKTMIECEKFLKNDPANVWALTRLGQAAAGLGYHETAALIFNDIRAKAPGNIENLHRLADAYEAKGDSQAAIQVCDIIIRAAPQDHEAAQKIKNLSALQSTAVFQHGAEKGSKSIVKNQDTHIKHGLETHEIRTVEQRQQAIAYEEQKLAEDKTGDPRHLATFHGNIGDMWLKVEPDFEKAEAAYQQARELQPTDFTYVFKLDDVNLARRRTALADLENRMKATPADAALKADYQRLRTEYNEFRMKSFEERVRRRPVDIKLGYALGSIYFEMGKLDEAIGQFQRTINDPAHRRDSLLRLGICFSRKSQFELAAKQFGQGLAEIEVMNEHKKLFLYHLGDTCERMGRKDEAVKAFTQLYEADIAFKDVQKRLEALKKG